MQTDRLWVKFAAVSVITAVVSVVVAALLIRNATSSNFDQYLQHSQSMQGMMGNGFGMMGPTETQFLSSINNSLWIAGLVAVVIAIVIAVLFSRQITAPLDRLSTAAARVRQGDLSHRVKATSNDEVGTLAQTFNGMVESLDKNQQMRRKLMADLAHEMGTPLAVLQSNLEGMLDGVVETSPSSIASLHQEALLLSRLVKDLRTLSQAESGRLSLAIAPGDLGELARSIVSGSEPEARRKNISLSLTEEDGLPQAAMDRDRISQVMTNLLSNAFRYTSAGDSVRVAVASRKDGLPGSKGSLIVSVSDTGQGISADDLPHIFNHYFRGKQAPEKRADGSGIGLAVVKELVEAHKGKVWAESTKGNGSTFYFTLPASN